MVDIIDQSWIDNWVRSTATPEEAQVCREWLQTIPPEQHGLFLRFPPLCLVRGRRALEVPFVFTVGIVVGYEGSTLHVRQSPEDPIALVPTEDLEVVGYWKGLSPDVVRKLLPGKVSHARHP